MLSFAPINHFAFLQCDKVIEAKEPFPVACLAQRSFLDLYWVFRTNQRLLYCRFKTKNISKKELVELIHFWLVASSILQTTIIFSHFWSIKTVLLDCAMESPNQVFLVLPLSKFVPLYHLLERLIVGYVLDLYFWNSFVSLWICHWCRDVQLSFSTLISCAQWSVASGGKQTVHEIKPFY